jgi:hypothetical protein
MVDLPFDFVQEGPATRIVVIPNRLKIQFKQPLYNSRGIFGILLSVTEENSVEILMVRRHSQTPYVSMNNCSGREVVQRLMGDEVHKSLRNPLLNDAHC